MKVRVLRLHDRCGREVYRPQRQLLRIWLDFWIEDVNDYDRSSVPAEFSSLPEALGFLDRQADARVPPEVVWEGEIK